jgi:hypothetical protein
VQVSQQATELTTTAIKDTDQSTTDQFTEEVIEETFWSPPDSTGKQYPQTTRTTTRTNATRTQNDKQTNIDQNINSNLLQTIEDNSEQAVQTREESTEKQTTKIRTPPWIIALILGIVAVAGILIYLLLKKYKIL